MCVGAWYGVLAVISQLSVVTNALLIAVTSNFVGFEVYIRGGYRDDYNRTVIVPDNDGPRQIVPDNDGAHQGLSGYVEWSQSVFLVSDLLDGEAFPAYNAQSLELLSDDGEDPLNGSSSDPPLYLPYIDFTCLNDYQHNCTFSTTTVMVERYSGDLELVETFSESQFEAFYSVEDCRNLVLRVSDPSESPKNAEDYDVMGTCFQNHTTCRLLLLIAIYYSTRKHLPVSNKLL